MLIPEMQKRNIRNSHHLPGYTLASKLSLCDLVEPTPSIHIQVQLVTYLQATEFLECKTFHVMCSLQNTWLNLVLKIILRPAQQP